MSEMELKDGDHDLQFLYEQSYGGVEMIKVFSGEFSGILEFSSSNPYEIILEGLSWDEPLPVENYNEILSENGYGHPQEVYEELQKLATVVNNLQGFRSERYASIEQETLEDFRERAEGIENVFDGFNSEIRSIYAEE